MHIMDTWKPVNKKVSNPSILQGQLFYKLRSNSQRAKKGNHGETAQNVGARFKPRGQRNLTSFKQI